MTSPPIRSQFSVDTRDTGEPVGSSAIPAVIDLPAHADAIVRASEPRRRSRWRFHAVALPLYAILVIVAMRPIFVPSGPEAGLGVFILAYAASFPLCYVFPIAPALVLTALGAPDPLFSRTIDTAIHVASFLATAYVQWFVLVPWLLRQFRRPRAGN